MLSRYSNSIVLPISGIRNILLKRTLFLTIVLVMTGAFARPGNAAYSFSTIDIPGAYETYAFGISGDNIVGYYSDASGTHGFLYDGTRHVNIDVPGALRTTPIGISGNRIVGYYTDSGGIHGFLYDGTRFQTIDVPGGYETYAYGISGNNIAGYYRNASGTHGFIFDGRNFRTIDVDGASETYIYGISGDRVAGDYRDSTGIHGFMYDGTGFRRFERAAYGINGNSIVGPGYFYDGAQAHPLIVPGSHATNAFGISGGNVAGYYSDANGTHGFFTTVPLPSTLFLFGSGLAGLELCRRRFRK